MNLYQQALISLQIFKAQNLYLKIYSNLFSNPGQAGTCWYLVIYRPKTPFSSTPQMQHILASTLRRIPTVCTEIKTIWQQRLYHSFVIIFVHINILILFSVSGRTHDMLQFFLHQLVSCFTDEHTITLK